MNRYRNFSPHCFHIAHFAKDWPINRTRSNDASGARACAARRAVKHIVRFCAGTKSIFRAFRARSPICGSEKCERRLYSVSCIVLSFFASSAAIAESGIASVYGLSDGHAGGKTASGERMNPTALVAAHRTLPFGTRVTVSHSGNGKSVVVRIIDRGPFIRGRVIDLSPAAARALGFSGLARVSIKREPIQTIPVASR